MKKAFVLSGGSIKGAFQAGAIAEILTSGKFIPDAIYGTSVGSLNGAFIADRAGRAIIAGKEPDWVEIGNELQNFWLQKITSFSKIGKKRNACSLLISILRKKFDGFIDTKPLRDLVHQEIKIENLLKSPIKFYACAVDVVTGVPIYANAEEHNDIIDYIIASTAIPMVMPFQIIKNKPFVDGGIREVAPLRMAIKNGAKEIYCILCQPKEMEKEKIDCCNAIDLMNRLMGIVTNETVNNDIDHCIQINDILNYMTQPVTLDKLQNKHNIKLKIIRPKEAIDLDLENFNSEQIKNALLSGWNESQA